MSPVVTALYDSRREADQALQALWAGMSLAHAGVYDRTDTSLQALRALDLTPEERHACEGKLATGNYLLLARARTGENPDDIVELLERMAAEPADEVRMRPPAEEAGAIGDNARVVAEECIPVVEEELRIGTREVVRGGARVRTRVEELPVAEEIELMSESVRVTSRAASRPVSDEELARSGLLRDRVIEIAQVREEAVVSKGVFVREEVVISKTTERRVEEIHETVRRTVIETEDLGGKVLRERGQR